MRKVQSSKSKIQNKSQGLIPAGLLLTSCFLLLASCLFPISALAFAPNVTKFILPNGMRWLLVERRVAPIFAGAVVVKAGGMDEEAGKTGLAHMLEHMAFKGTREITSEELWDILARNGAEELNASTNKDTTTYYMMMPKEKLDLWMYLSSAIIFNPEFRGFEKEQKVVVEERRTSIENNPAGKLIEALLNLAFKDSPYGWSTIGVDVEKLKRADLNKFHNEHYAPNNMVGVIVGDIDVPGTKEMIEKYWGGGTREEGRLPAVALAKAGGTKDEGRRTKDACPPKLEERRREGRGTLARRSPPEADEGGKDDSSIVLATGGSDRPSSIVISFPSEPQIAITFHKPTLPHEDDYVFDMITTLLCEGPAARFEKLKRITQTIWCDSSFPGARLSNLFIVSAAPLSPATNEKLKKSILRELNKLKTRAVPVDELDRARARIKAALMWQAKDHIGLASLLGYFESIAGDWQYIVEHEERMKKITPEDVKRVAKKYFTPENMVVVELERRK